MGAAELGAPVGSRVDGAAVAGDGVTQRRADAKSPAM